MMYQIPVVEIPDDNGEGYRLRILRDMDADLYFSIVQGSERITLRSVRICAPSGNPSHREVWEHLLYAFEAAERLGYGVKET